MRSRVSLFVHDLAGNPIVRAAVLARALERDYDVEVLGFLQTGHAVYEPYRGMFEYRAVPCPNRIASVVDAVPHLANLAGGDLIFACKPLVTSFLPALWAARNRHKPLFLDIEDDEWAAPHSGALDFVWRHVLKGWRHATAWKYTRAMHPLLRFADGVSVSTTGLRRRYGGVIVHHGPDEARFDPDLPALADAPACRAQWRLALNAPIALFAGIPRPHKGWGVLLDALDRPEASAWHLAIAGPPECPEFDEARARLGDRCHVIGTVSNDDMPSLLAAADAVPVPQLDLPFARMQLPAKLVEAMAMRRPVIASAVGDLPSILGEGARGYLVAPSDSAALAAAFASIARDGDDAARRASAARKWFLENGSVEATRMRLRTLMAAHAVV